MKILKLILWVTGIIFLLAVPFIFLPWSELESIMSWFSIEESLPYTPITIYFFKVSFAVYGLIGIFFIMLARDPFKYGPMLNLAAYSLILGGLIALSIGLSIDLSPIIYLGDCLSGLVLGIAILFFSSKAKKA